MSERDMANPSCASERSQWLCRAVCNSSEKRRKRSQEMLEGNQVSKSKRGHMKNGEAGREGVWKSVCMI